MDLKEKYNNYLELIKTEQDQHGFIQSDECDSLLFTGLVGSVPSVTVDIMAAFDVVSQTWQRRATDCPCYPDGAPSTISRDMLLGLAWYAYFNKRLDISEQIIKYAMSHWCMMGKAATWKDRFGRCFMTPGMLATYAEISYRIGGPNRWWLRYLPQYESPTVVDFQAHLSVLHILLRKKLTGSVSKSHMKILQDQSTRQPFNALFAIAAGKLDLARQTLGVRDWFPEGRLPTSADRSEPWIWQRDYGSDWKSSPPPLKTHSGGDYLFAYWLLQAEG